MRSALARLLALLLVLGVAGSCAPPTPLSAQPPDVEPLARRAVGGRFELELLGVSDQKTCGHHPKFNDLCVSRLRSAVDAGLNALLGQFIDRKRPGDGYRASFQLLEFAQDAAFIGEGDFEHPKIVLRWRFELKNSAGQRLLLLTDTTGEAFRDVRQASETLQGILEDMLEQIGQALNDAEWRASPAERRSRLTTRTAYPR